jgi:2-polyprenyl-6-methoxyphenol hydroxylase-like FAD-dependent oxidoreductase
VPSKKQTAYVIGASLGGLLAAAALSGRFDRVVLFERDNLPDDDRVRRGVPQGRHLHMLLSSGRTAIEALLPGFTDDMLAGGAHGGDLQRDMQWIVDGEPLPRLASGLFGLTASRPFLERRVRNRVRELPGVEIRTGRTVTGLITDSAGRVTGVQTDAGALTGAELVVDASGRGSRARHWLVDLGYPEAEVEGVDVRLTYVSRAFRMNGADLGAPLASLSSAQPGQPYGGSAIAEEDGRIRMTLSGMAGTSLPTDDEGLLTCASNLPPASPVPRLLKAGRPLGPASLMRFPTEWRRRFDRMDRFPQGFLPFGDTLCSFNPVYAQGMSVAALEAVLLRDLAGQEDTDLSARFLRESATLVDAPWTLALANDRRYATDAAPDPFAQYLTRLRTAMHHDPVLAAAFLRVTQLVESPSTLRAPEIVARVAA